MFSFDCSWRLSLLIALFGDENPTWGLAAPRILNVEHERNHHRRQPIQ
jgi:hypothetical protein